MPATCFTCDEVGHIAANCPYQDDLDTRPRWCGICDPRTRLVTVELDSGRVKRCYDCHPASQKSLPQHKRCPGCHAVVHAWDSAPCGKHSVPGAVRAARHYTPPALTEAAQPHDQPAA